MGTIGYSTGHSEVPPVPLGGNASASREAAEDHIDPDLVQQTRLEIRRLVREITRICQSDIALDDFYEAFLGCVVSALAAVGGAIWLREANGRIRLRYQINLAESGLSQRDEAVADHQRLLDRVAATVQTTAVAPESLDAELAASGNPTPWVLLLGSLAIDDEVRAVVEVFQRPDGGPVTQRGYLRFLTQVCELADDFMKRRRLRELQGEKKRWLDLETFLGTIHRQLDLQATAFAIANEGRRLLDVDRASVVVRHHGRCEVLSISGLDTIEPRADQVRSMNQLVATVISGGEPLWYPSEDAELPPEIDQALQRHVDQSHARMVGVIPIGALDRQNESHEKTQRCPIAAVVVERFEDSSVSTDLRRQTNQIARHAGSALNNCLAHRRASASSPVRMLASLRTAVGRGAPAKTFAAVTVLLVIAVALTFVPATLRIGARGTLRPRDWRNVFAGIDGTIEEIAVQHGQTVRKGQVLARMRNAELEMEIAALAGQKQTISEQILAVQRTLLERGRVSAEQRSRLTADLEQLEQRLLGVESQLNVERKRRESLVVRSPIAGRVVTWDVEKELAARPVRRGCVLMTVVDPTSGWEMDLCIDERDIGHIMSAAGWNGSDADLNRAASVASELPVTFFLRTCPGREFRGRLVQLDRTSREDESGRNILVARAQIDAAQLPEVPSGATVRARIDCQSRSIGYVWFRDLIDIIGTEVLFWL